MNKETLKEIIMWVLIDVTVLIVGIWIINTTPKTIPKQQNKSEIICEHEYIVTSKYNLLLRQYKTISKCTKCGREV